MLTSGLTENNLLLIDIVPSMPQLLDNAKPLQTRISESVVPPPYPETAYQWLVKVLDGLIAFGKRHGHYGVINLSDREYEWLDGILEKLIYSVGENESHPLAPLMDFIIRIIANYEEKYVPKLTELYPELAEETPIKTTNENSNPSPPYASELSDSELAAHSFCAIGCLLWEGGKAEKAVAAYDTAIRLLPDCAEVYNNRGNIKSGLGSHDAAIDDYDKAIRLNANFAEAYSNRGAMKFGLGKHAVALADLNEAIRLQPDFMNAYINRGIAQLSLDKIDEAEADLQKALELANQQENIDAKVFIEAELQQLNQAALKQSNKKPRQGGQWKGKVKIADDFDELPESLVDECTKDKRMDKAFEQILEIAFDAGLLVFMTDEDNAYTQRVLIERPVEDKNKDSR